MLQLPITIIRILNSARANNTLQILAIKSSQVINSITKFLPLALKKLSFTCYEIWTVEEVDLWLTLQVSVSRKRWQRHGLLRAENDKHAKHPEHWEDKKPLQQFIIIHVECEGEVIREIEPVPVNHLYQNSACRPYSYRRKLYAVFSRLIYNLALPYPSLSLVVTGNQQGGLHSFDMK